MKGVLCMKTQKHKILALLLVFVIGIILAMPVFAENAIDESSLALETTGVIVSYQIIVEGFDWGPGVTKLIFELDGLISADRVNVNDFSLQFHRQPDFVSHFWRVYDIPILQNATITNAFLSNSAGVPVTTNSRFITLTILVHPDYRLGVNPFTFTLEFFPFEIGNTWSNPFVTFITWNNRRFTPTRTARIIPIADEFTRDRRFEHGNVTLVYGFFTPPEAQTSNRPLIIWLHGGSEGSKNLLAGTNSVLLGSRVTQLAAPEIQRIMGGAHILLPQASTIWMEGSGDNNGRSVFEDALMALIDHFLEITPNIDRNRIYIGGCSNGGFMTIRALLLRPDLFAASFPICLGYNPNFIRPGQMESIAHIPMWLTHDYNDPEEATPFAHSRNIYNLLRAAGHENLHFTVTHGIFSDEFFDERGRPWEFDAHFSWIPVLNNAVFNDQGLSIFEWLAAQTLSNVIEYEYEYEEEIIPVPTAPTVVNLIATGVFNAGGQTIQNPFRNIGGSGLVAFRAIGYILGWEINFNDTGIGPMWASFTSPDGLNITITAGSYYARINGQLVQMVDARGIPVQAQIVNRNFFIPIRFFDESPLLPVSIEWIEGPPQSVMVIRH